MKNNERPYVWDMSLSDWGDPDGVWKNWRDFISENWGEELADALCLKVLLEGGVITREQHLRFKKKASRMASRLNKKMAGIGNRSGGY